MAACFRGSAWHALTGFDGDSLFCALVSVKRRHPRTCQLYRQAVWMYSRMMSDLARVQPSTMSTETLHPWMGFSSSRPRLGARGWITTNETDVKIKERKATADGFVGMPEPRRGSQTLTGEATAVDVVPDGIGLGVRLLVTSSASAGFTRPLVSI
ncbi:hypothetical protein CFC21_016567 [Triticum aestivum]|uniref:Uncharacterized protein n=2 Tax=Triticum aestivum TaxID=4565 RepID=A0A3B6AXN5_WHEAT|nr:hypothetical protein CFC21_016567 [Triticum aestivum]